MQAKWERQKRHLLRNFLVNPGFQLSPIPEEERSSSSSECDSLPDLVVEPAPDRHDHPPDFYEGLERRVKRLYRQLFIGLNESDDDSLDFEVNLNMGSTFILDIHARKENEATGIADKNSIGDLDDSIAKKRELTMSTNESDEMRQVTKSTNENLDDENESQDEYDDELIDTCATYYDTRHVSADSICSSVEDEEHLNRIEYRSINESIHSNKSDDPNVNIENYGNKQTCDKGAANRDGVKETGDLNASKISEGKPNSGDEALHHRISTTVAEIHEARPDRRSTQVCDNGSPVLIPRLLQFSRRVFGSRKSGDSFNVSQASDEFIRRLSSHKSDASNKHDDNIEEPQTQIQRLLAASELTKASLDFDKLDTEHIVDHIDTEDKNQEVDVNENDIEDIIQPHEITRTSLASNKTLHTENMEDYVDADENDEIEDRTGIEEIIQPHEITRTSLASNKTLHTENIEDYVDAEENDNNDEIEDIIEPHEITRASLTSNNTLDTDNSEDYVDNEENKQDDKTYDTEDKSQLNKQNDNEGDKADTDVDNETSITGSSNASINRKEDSIDDDEDSFENSVRRGVFARKARKMFFISSSEESVDDLEPIAHSSAKSIDDEVEVMREARKADGTEGRSSHGEAVNQDSPALAFEAQTNADKPENDSSDSSEINASFQDHDIAKITDEFWSVSPEDVDIEPAEVSRSNKRRTYSEANVPFKRRKTDVTTQTGLEEICKRWEVVKPEFFVGTPLIFRLCRCQNHVCS